MSQGMQALVSVNSAAEAQLVLSAGVPLIDLKDTSHGALAALDMETSKKIIAIVHGHRQQYEASDIVVSATIGDHCASADELSALIKNRLEIGVDVIKLPEATWADPSFRAIIHAFLEQGAKIIAVCLPNSLTDSTLVQRLHSLATQGYWGVMVDTVQKSDAIVNVVTMAALAEFIRAAKSFDLVVGIAGGLALVHVEMLSRLNPDYLGFRSGVSENGLRSLDLVPDRVHQMVSMMSRNFVG